jgi:UMF1 family MFS transporter
MEKNNKKIINAWCMYDWANSVYTLTITTAIFPIYFNAVTTQPDGNDVIPFLWMSKKNSVVYTYSLSVAFLITSFLSPLLSGIADYGGIKKTFMRFFAYTGSLSCMALFFFTADTIPLGILFFILAGVGYAGSLVFYNAYLPEIATPDRFDQISAKGYSLGYVGSVFLLIINLIVIQKPSWFGLEAGTLPARISFLMVGLWWLGFSQYAFAYLPSDPYQKPLQGKYLLRGFTELKKVFREVRKNRMLKSYLTAFFFYSMGFQTIMYLAGLFGSKELHLPEDNLIGVLLIIQLVAVGGAMLFTRSATKIGNLLTLMLAIILCIIVCICAYYIYLPLQFYLLAVVVGIIMGGIQSLSRSTYTKLLPDTTDHASYFSFYEFTEKVGIVIGTATYALIDDLTNSMRNSIFALIVFFLIGLFFLIRIIAADKKYRAVPV